MLWARWVIYGIPLSFTALATWSARQAGANRAVRGGEIVIASDENAPSLNPFMPSCEVDRQITALVHRPLFRIGAEGRIEPALASRWTWSQTSSVWFAAEKYAADAAEKLSRLDADTRAKLGVTAIEVTGTEIKFTFDKPGASAATKLLPAIADCGPLPVEIIRVELNESVRGYHEFFMKNSVETAQVKRVWFDGDRACELAISGETVKFAQELNLFYQNRPELQPRVRSLGTSSMLHRPALEIELRDDAKFTDGSPVTADDVIATVSFVLSQPWPGPGRDVLRLISSLEAKDAHTLRAVFNEIHGPALTGFLDLPILPASWLAKYQGDPAHRSAAEFIAHPPPGAGTARIESTAPRAIYLEAGKETRVEFLLNQPPNAIRMGFAMRAVDGFWPQWSAVPVLAADRDVTLRAMPARSRLLVMWNCRKPPLDDPRVRAALGRAVDRGALLRELLHGQGTVQEGIFEPGLWFAQKLSPSPFEPDEAARLFADLGWQRDGTGILKKDGAPFRIELLTVAGNTDRAQIAQRLRKAWTALGVEVTITATAQDELVNLRLPEHRFDAALIGLDFERSWDQSPFWHSSQSRGGMNFSGLSDSTLDGLLEAARVEFELDKVPRVVREVENRILGFHPFLPLFSGSSAIAVRRDALPALNAAGVQLDQTMKR